MILINYGFLLVIVALNYKNANYILNVYNMSYMYLNKILFKPTIKNNYLVARLEIQIVSFSYPTEKILKTSNNLVSASAFSYPTDKILKTSNNFVSHL